MLTPLPPFSKAAGILGSTLDDTQKDLSICPDRVTPDGAPTVQKSPHSSCYCTFKMAAFGPVELSTQPLQWRGPSLLRIFE